MTKANINSKKGFTIIEVVLVLAIAGLIFLMVFVALPALQRNQRDTERRNNYDIISSAVTSYASDHYGKIPENANAEAFSKYIDPGLKDPSTGESYRDEYTTALQFEDATYTTLDKPTTAGQAYVSIIIHAVCDVENDTVKTQDDDGNAYGDRTYAVIGALESEGFFCSDNGD